MANSQFNSSTLAKLASQLQDSSGYSGTEWQVQQLEQRYGLDYQQTEKLNDLYKNEKLQKRNPTLDELAVGAKLLKLFKNLTGPQLIFLYQANLQQRDEDEEKKPYFNIKDLESTKFLKVTEMLHNAGTLLKLVEKVSSPKVKNISPYLELVVQVVGVLKNELTFQQACHPEQESQVAQEHYSLLLYSYIVHVVNLLFCFKEESQTENEKSLLISFDLIRQTFILALINIDQFLKATGDWLKEENVIEVFATGLLVTIKNHLDIYYNNEIAAKVFTFSLENLNKMEVAFLKGVNWNVFALTAAGPSDQEPFLENYRKFMRMKLALKFASDDSTICLSTFENHQEEEIKNYIVDEPKRLRTIEDQEIAGENKETVQEEVQKEVEETVFQQDTEVSSVSTAQMLQQLSAVQEVKNPHEKKAIQRKPRMKVEEELNPLDLAIVAKNKEQIQKLLETGVDPSEISRDIPPLSSAVVFFPECLAMLLEKKPDATAAINYFLNAENPHAKVLQEKRECMEVFLQLAEYAITNATTNKRSSMVQTPTGKNSLLDLLTELGGFHVWAKAKIEELSLKLKSIKFHHQLPDPGECKRDEQLIRPLSP